MLLEKASTISETEQWHICTKLPVRARSRKGDAPWTLRVADLKENVNQRPLPLGLECNVEGDPGAVGWVAQTQSSRTACRLCLICMSSQGARGVAKS